MQPSDWIALAAVAATAFAAWIVHLDRSSDRAHVERLAREQREQDRRATTYRDMLVMVLEVEDAVRTTLPIWGRVGDTPHPGPTQAAQRVMQANVAAYGSPQIVELYEAAGKLSREFQEAVSMFYASEKAELAGAASSDTAAARKLIEAKRQAFIESRLGLEKHVRAELAQ